MEDDDEFGDLYTDVLRPFAISDHHSPQPTTTIDLNQIPSAAPHDTPPPSTNQNQPGSPEIAPELPPRVSPQPDPVEALNDGGGEEAGDDAAANAIDPMDRDVKFDIEEDDGGGAALEPVIPGLSGGDAMDVDGGTAGGGGGGEGDDWDSDSEDDLQIVLNDDNRMAMERGGVVDDDDEDEDGGLVIVAGGDPSQGLEEQDWGNNATLVADGEGKDAAELAKNAAAVGGGGVAAVPKIGYGGHGYHPFHSQFKYVRPGAAPIPGATTSSLGGPPGQIRPLAIVAGRGRGEWRPPGIKGAAGRGPGLPGWGNNAAGRGFGGGLEFTLPSHKTIFEVDIENFEEKPWKYPNVDVSDFFNFGLNEDSWKDYCKQLEQLRLESTMQSKIRVYESGRTEQEYDPDLPPELAAATGIHDVPVENASFVKSDVGQSDVMKGSGRVRPPLPTGRAIQVEGGYGERLPSIDTRPPRIRDSDAIIEIVLQDAEDDDSSAGDGVQDQPVGGEPMKEDFREDHVARDEIPRLQPEYFDGFPQDYDSRKKELAGRRMPFMKSSPANLPDEDEKMFFPPEEPTEYSGSRGQNPRSHSGNFSSSREERKKERRGRSHSPISPIRKLTTDDIKKAESLESMEGRHSRLLASPFRKDTRDSSVDDKDTELEDTGTANGSSRLEKEEMDLNAVDKVDTLEDGIEKKQKLTSEVEQPLLDEVDDWEDSKTARSSDNSKARSAGSRDNQKQRESLDEEVVQDPRSAQVDSIRQPPDENEQGFHRRERDGKQEPERNRMVLKGREGSYPYKDRHRSSVHANTDGFDRQKDRDNSDMDWAGRDDDLFSRRVRNDEPRKRDRAKVRENERNNKEDSLHSRKQLDNGSYRVPYDKDIGPRDSRHRERDEGLRIRYEAVDDYHGKRRRDEEYLRREHIDKEEILHGYRENASRRRRERDGLLDPRKRDELQRSRDYPDDQYAGRLKDDTWLLRERGDRPRDREDWHRMKQPHEEHLPKREREEGRASLRSGRGSDEKAWVGHVSAKDEQKFSEKEYQGREVVRHNDQLKRRDRIQDESPHHKGRDDAYTRGNQYATDEKRSRQERSSSRGDHVANASDNQRAHERKHKEGSRKSKERDVSDLNSLGLAKKSQEIQSGSSNEKGLKASGNEDRAQREIPGHRMSRKHQDGMSSDDEQHDSRRGRSKLERWTSHKERDFSIGKSSSSLKFKVPEKDNDDGSSEAGKPVDESVKTVDVDNQHLSSAEAKESADLESRDADRKDSGDQRLDTVERLKKRSERFKLPMPSEKEAIVIKKLESEPLPSATQSETPVETEVKQERPARKRRWISS
ncbi:FIP1[V]-like protein isoform X2 [Lotus japonicus]|uniref:FIP1[V]-like protein isoform X2 n=1 Tax=Lotus japonicus TaxID=34305 RepID=UPI002584D693|nr:FIP1[V]-like protein isoform X2 [Lotus japonicus]